MMASLRFSFIVLSMPKCASSSLQQALMPICDVRFKDHMKHVDLAFVQRWVLPMLSARRAPAPFVPRIFSLMRDPIDWLYSWYRYAWHADGQPIPGRGVPTNGPVYPTFAAFLEGYFSPRPPRLAGLLRQSDLLRGLDGTIGEVELIRFENLPRLLRLLEEISGTAIELKVTNQSRPPRPIDFTALDLSALRRRLSEEYAIYNAIPEA